MITREMPQPTDRITVTPKQVETLFSLWADSVYKDGKTFDDEPIPSDLFYSNTIPLKNCEIDGFFTEECMCKKVFCNVFDEPRHIEIPGIDGVLDLLMKIRVDVDDITVAAIIAGMESSDKAIVYSAAGWQNGQQVNINDPKGHRIVNRYLTHCLQVWYSVQLAMLHPMIKEVYAKAKTEKERLPKSEWKSNNQKTYRYIKHHVIRDEELTDIVYGKGHIHRHALIWYVTGHWRKYKTGNTVFIQGYWKGALRNTKKGKVRNREIVTAAEGITA